MKFWRKEVPSQCYLPDGRKIACDFQYESVGFISSDNGYVNNQIAKAVAQHIGGWSETDEQTYNTALNELAKKKVQEQSNPNQHPNKTRKQWFRADPSLARKVAGSVGRKSIEVPISPRPDPIRVPTPEQMKPRKGPIPKEAFI